MCQRIGPPPHPHPPPLRQLLGRARQSVLAGATPARPRRTTPSTPTHPSSPAPAQASSPIGHNYPVARGAILLQHAPTADGPRRDVRTVTMHTDNPPTFADGEPTHPHSTTSTADYLLHRTILRSINAHRISLSSCLLRATSSTARRIIRIHHPPHLSSLVQPSPFAAPLTVSPFVFVACLRIRYAYERACPMHEWPMAYIQWS